MNNGRVQRLDQRQGINKALDFLDRGTYKASGEALVWSLYDTFSIDGTTPTLRHNMFVVRQGQIDPVTAAAKTLADTNVESATPIPAGHHLDIYALKIMYIPDEIRTPAEMINIFDMLADTTLIFDIKGKASVLTLTLTEFMGIPFSGVIVPAATNYNPTISNGRFVGIFPLRGDLPIIISQNTSFQINIEHHVAPNAGLDNDRVKISLCGVLDRLS